MSVRQQRGAQENGFTLIELLVVIVILGILSTVTVFAVTGVNSRAEESSCSADRKTLEIALETYRASRGSAAVSEAQLVAAGLLLEASEYHDIVDNQVVAALGNPNRCA